ncbi:MAG TPA: hypothetical protein VIP11_24870 [Gemmatimonadaceae bacterium]
MRRAWASRVIGLLVLVSGRGWGQSVTLQIRPHTGDTLRMRLDQQTEMTGIRRTSSGELSAVVLNTMKMFSRAIVEGASEKGTMLLAVTDSVLVTTTDESARADAERAQKQMRGQRIRFRVSLDGTVVMTETENGAAREVAQVVSLMPAAFPKAPIKVGESWIREMPLPASPQYGSQIAGRLHVTFRFDSLTHGGEWAFVSMRGEMRPLATPPAGSGAMLEKGFVSGTMLVDQRRGWLTESWFSIVTTSVITPPFSTGLGSLQVQMRIIQHMHTEKRKVD